MPTKTKNTQLDPIRDIITFEDVKLIGSIACCSQKIMEKLIGGKIIQSDLKSR